MYTSWFNLKIYRAKQSQESLTPHEPHIRIAPSQQDSEHHLKQSYMKYEEVIAQLKATANPEAVKGMARFGISAANTLGVSIPNLRKMARTIGKNHQIALQLWVSGIHEARILASIIDDPGSVTSEQVDKWALDFDSWDICDQCCSNLFHKTGFAVQKTLEYSSRDEEFVKRTAFALMAVLAVHAKKADNRQFEEFLSIIKRESTDERNFVKKAVNWALRQIGKRNLYLNQKAIETAREIQGTDSKAARWVASNAISELTSQSVQKRLKA
jgi:3-methyladenine DNA glycosylase AlkD